MLQQLICKDSHSFTLTPENTLLEKSRMIWTKHLRCILNMKKLKKR